MFQRGELQQIGRKFVVGGLLVIAFTLLVIVADEVLGGGGSDAVRATCVLFLWAGGVAIALGIVLRIFGMGWSAPMPRTRPRRR